MLKSLLKTQKGFTLIELLAVMAIVATLAAIVATQVAGSGETSRDVQAQQDATTVGTAVGEFRAVNGGPDFLFPNTVTVLGEPGILQETSILWPEVFITTAFPGIFSETTTSVGAISFFNEDGTPSVLSVRGLLENYTAIDFPTLREGGFLQQLPKGLDIKTEGFDNYLWLFKKDTVAGGGGTVSSREVEVFKLVTVQAVEGTAFRVLAYLRIFGEEILNDLPTAFPQSLVTLAGTSLNVTLQGIDPESDALTFTVVADPDNGTLSGTPPNLTYTPSIGFEGTDAFAFKVNDGISDSAPAIVFIKVIPVDTEPPPGDDPGGFVDTNGNKIADNLDDDIAAAIANGSPATLDIVVIFTEAFFSQAIDNAGKLDEVVLALLVGGLLELQGGVPINAVIDPIDTISTTLTPIEILFLALQGEVIQIEKDEGLGI